MQGVEGRGVLVALIRSVVVGQELVDVVRQSSASDAFLGVPEAGSDHYRGCVVGWMLLAAFEWAMWMRAFSYLMM